MALKADKLTAAEAAALLNSTPRGEVITTRRVGLHLRKYRFKIGDGKKIHLPRYLAWMILNRHQERPPDEPVDSVRYTRKCKLLDDSVRYSIKKCISLGMPYRETAAYSGVSESGLMSWLATAKEAKRNQEAGRQLNKQEKLCLGLLEDIEESKANFVHKNLARIDKAADEGVWQASACLLQRRRPEIFAEVSGGDSRGNEAGLLDIWDEAAILRVAMEGTMRGIAPPPGMLPEAWTTFRVAPSQLKYLGDTARFQLLLCGRSSGKTEMVVRRLVMALSEKKQWSNPCFFYCAPTNAQAIRVAWDRIGRLIPQSWMRGRPHRTEQFYETIFGSRFYVLGMDQPSRFEGKNEWDDGVVDESSDQKPGVFDLSIYPALEARRGGCKRIGVPKRYGPGARDFFGAIDKALAGELPDTSVHMWESAEVLSPQAIEEARRRLDVRDFREQYLAKREAAGGAVFFAFSKDSNVRPCAYDPTLPLIVGCDFGMDPMCWAICHIREGRIEWFDEIFLRDANTPATLGVLWDRYANHRGGFVFVGDAAGRARDTSANLTDYAWIENDKRLMAAPGSRRVLFPKSNPCVADRFAATNAMLCNAAGERRMYVDPHCTRIIEDLSMRAHESDHGGDLTHMTDAVGYVVWMYFGMAMYPPVTGTATVGVYLPS